MGSASSAILKGHFSLTLPLTFLSLHFFLDGDRDLAGDRKKISEGEGHEDRVDNFDVTGFLLDVAFLQVCEPSHNIRYIALLLRCSSST